MKDFLVLRLLARLTEEFLLVYLHIKTEKEKLQNIKL